MRFFINCLAGVLIGAFVVRQFSVGSACKKSALYVFVIQTLVVVVPFVMLIPACLNVNIAGVSNSHIDR